MSGPWVREAIRELRAYALEPRLAPTKLDQNESPADFPDDLKEEVARRVARRAWNRYPEFETTRLREAIARHHGLGTAGVLAGNGSNELLLAAVLTLVSPGTRVLLPVPTFSLYEKLAAVAGGSVERLPFDPAAGVIPAEPLLERCGGEGPPPVVIVCSPNNPSGAVLERGAVERLLAAGAVVILDRAYGEFDGAPLPAMHDRLAVLSTFSKAWGIAALRVGWLASTPDTCREIRKVKLPYSMNVFSEEAAIVALENAARCRARVEEIVEARERMARELGSIPGVRPYPSKANFIAFETATDPRDLFRALLESGFLVRDVSGMAGMERALRVSIGTPEENERLVAAVRDAMKEAE